MAEFPEDLQSFRPSFPFLDIDNMEIQNLVPFDSLLGSPEPQFPGNLEGNFPGLFQCVDHNAVPVLVPISSNEVHEGKKREATDMCDPSSGNSTPDISESGSKSKNVKFLPLVHFIVLFMHNFFTYMQDIYLLSSEFWKRQESEKECGRRQETKPSSSC